MQRSPGQGEGIGKSGHGIAIRDLWTLPSPARATARLPSPWSGRGIANVGSGLKRAGLLVSVGLHLWKNDFQVLAQAAAVSLCRVVIVGHYDDRRTLGTAEQRGLRRGALHEAQGLLIQFLAVQHRRAFGD